MALFLEYARDVLEDVRASELTDARSVEQVKSKLQQAASVLLKVQEWLTNQIYYVGVH